MQEQATYSLALAGMVDRPFLATERWREQQTRAVRTGAHPDLLEFERVFIRRIAKLGVPMFASEVVRTRDRQADLYALGNTRARPGRSPHQFGLAVDLVHSERGWELTRKQWAMLGHFGREVAGSIGVKVEWGGSWSFYDPAHWELEGWQAMKGGYPYDGR